MINTVVGAIVFAVMIALALIGIIAWWIIVAVALLWLALYGLVASLGLAVLAVFLSATDRKDDPYAVPFGDQPRAPS